MFPSANYYSSAYVVSECTSKQLAEKLFYKNGSLKSDFSCLIERSIKSYSEKKRKTLNSIALYNHLPGYMLSMSDQCRLATNDPQTYACPSRLSSNEICHKLMCSSNGVCQRQMDEVLDGTACGYGRVCWFSECHDVQYLIKGMFFYCYVLHNSFILVFYTFISIEFNLN